MTCDTAMLARAAQVLFAPGSVVEMRILNTFRDGTVSGYFDHTLPLVQAAEAWSGKAPSLLHAQPCPPRPPGQVRQSPPDAR